MKHARNRRASDILLALSELTPSSEQRSRALTIPTEWFRWLPARAVHLLGREQGSVEPHLAEAVVDRGFAAKLAAVDQIRPEQRSLRAGWLFVAGRTVGGDGASRPVFHPLVTTAVKVVRATPLTYDRVVAVDDVAISDLVTDPVLRHRLERELQLGGGAIDWIDDPVIPTALLAKLPRLRRFAIDLAAAAGLPARRVVPATKGPEALRRSEDLAIVAGVGVFAVHDTGTTTRAGSLRTWAAERLTAPTAFHAMYLSAGEDRTGAGAGDEQVESPYQLTPAQRSVVVHSRSHPLTLVSGAPGTGKSHTVAAIALDAVGRGETVLVAAKSDASVDALVALFERAPGTDPVVFGSNERRHALAGRLAAGQAQPSSEGSVSSSRRSLDDALARRDEIRAGIVHLLEAEQILVAERVGATIHETPGSFDDHVDPREVEALLAAARRTGGWWTRRRADRARLALVARAGADARSSADTHASADALERQWRAALRFRRARLLDADGGLDLTTHWQELEEAERRVRSFTARWLARETRSPARLNPGTMPAVTALATALRSGRGARREQLARLGDGRLTRALPLWVGSLPDIDDLLPMVPGLFDLVILDEAASIDQPLAAPGLLRARRGVVVGDPRQLRHVSFLADDLLRSVLRSHHLEDDPLLAARLDVRRNSVFDACAAVTPVHVLDEHFRSAPHLMDFVARRLYGGTVKIATRTPRTDTKDCVRVVRLEGARDDAGVVDAEVTWVMGELRRLLVVGARSVGVVTPFRAQADALEAAVIAGLSVDELERLDLRVGTVHAFQGNERDTILVSLGIGTGEGLRSWRFVEDPALFAVMVTRARRHLTVAISAEPPDGGLVADYLAQADALPGTSSGGRPSVGRASGDPGEGATSVWAASIADDVEVAGVTVRRGYATGRHVVDLVVTTPLADVAVECEVHPEGAAHHVERHLSLRHAGWTILEAHRSRWRHRRGELVVELLAELGAGHTSPRPER